MAHRSEKLISNFIIFSLGNIGSKLLFIFLLPLYTSVLSVSEYGNIDLISTTATLLLPIVTLGLNEAIFRFVMVKNYPNASVIRIGIRVPCSVYSATLIVLLVINFFVKWEYLGGMLILLLTHMIYEIFLNYTKAIGDSKIYAIIGVFQTFLLLSFNILFLCVFSYGIKGYLAAYCLSYFIPGVILACKYKLIKSAIFQKYSSAEKSLKDEMLKYSVPLIFNTISWLIIMSSDRYMIKWLLGINSVGIYSVATKIPVILQTLITVFTTAWEISSNDIYENDKVFLPQFYERGMKYYVAVGYCGGSFLILICPFLMRFLAQGDFYQGWRYAPFLILSVVFSTSGGLNGAIYSAFKDNRGAFFSTFYGAIINLFLNYFGIKYIGIYGATISTVLSRFFISIYRTKDTEKFLNYKRDYKRVTICSFLIVLQSIVLVLSSHSSIIVQIVFLLIIILYNYNALIEIAVLTYSHFNGGRNK